MHQQFSPDGLSLQERIKVSFKITLFNRKGIVTSTVPSRRKMNVIFDKPGNVNDESRSSASVSQLKIKLKNIRC